jgi:hypothetical protein
MATTFNLSPTEKQGVLDFIVGNLNNPEVIANAAKRYGATANDLASITGLPVDQVNLYFSQAGITLPTFSDQYGFQEDSGTVVKTAEQQRQEYIKEQERLASLTPAQKAIENAKYTESLEGGNETRYNPVNFQGREWLVGPSGDNLVTMSKDQSGLSGNFKRYDILDPTTGQVTQQVSEDRSMWQRFVKALPKIALGAAAVVGGPALLEAASGLFEGAGAATTAGSTALPAASTLTGTVAGLAPETLAALEATGLANIPGIVSTTGGLLEAGLAAGAAGTVANAANTTKSLTDAAKVASAASSVVNALSNPDASSLLGDLIGSGANLAMVNDAADKLRKQGQISQEEYNKLSTNLFNAYRDVGQGAGTALANIGERASQMVGDFTPYGVSTNLVNTRVNPQTGQLESNLTDTAQMLMAPLGRAAIQSAQAAEMTNVDQLSKDYYNKLAALSAPEAQRQRLATEERMRQQGRLGLLGSGLDVAGKQVSTAAPELTALEQALARQQLEREVQSRNLALGERGTLLGQAQQAYAPLQQISQQALQQAQLSGQLGQLSQAGRIAQTNAYMQPAMTGITAPLNLFSQGLPQVASTQRLGIASNLAAQQAALDAQAIGRTNVANQLLGQNGSNIGSLINSAVGLFNQPSNYLPGTNITYADALNQGLIAI